MKNRGNKSKLARSENFQIREMKNNSWTVVAEDGTIISEGFSTELEAEEFANNGEEVSLSGGAFEKVKKQRLTCSGTIEFARNVQFYRCDEMCGCGFSSMQQSNYCYSCNTK